MFNYMDGVPVKISESYKPLPKVFQIPQAIANRLQQSTHHYYESSQYDYDFQLEKKVLAQLIDWRRVRQHESGLRRDRRRAREELRMQEMEQHNKQMLGAVCYPDAEDLSTDSDSDNHNGNNGSDDVTTALATRQVVSEVGNFHNILQPTILPQAPPVASPADSKRMQNTNVIHTRNKSSSSFNYKDFEEDTSSPFDSIELKTIDDLDILAQVLKHAQVRVQEKETDDTSIKDFAIKNNSAETINCQSKEVSRNDIAVNADANCRATFSPVNHHNNINNPQNTVLNPNDNATCGCAAFQEQYFMDTHFQSNSNINTEIQTKYFGEEKSLTTNEERAYTNTVLTNSHNSSCDITAGHNDNLLYMKNIVVGGVIKAIDSTNCELKNQFVYKCKSVPDILKELKNEVHNSEIRRLQNSNFNIRQEKGTIENAYETLTTKNTKPSMSCYTELDAPIQEIVCNISSMGFPLERVAKLAQVFGANDKKIMEHLIPLSEMIDMGFDEPEISEALFRFNNNKERALDYLIS